MTGEWGPQGWVLIIGAIFVGITNVISAYFANRAKIVATEVRDKQEIVRQKAEQVEKKADLVASKAEDNSRKIDRVHELTDGNLSRVQDELSLEKKKNSFLEKLIIEITAECPQGTLDKAKRNIEVKEAKIGKRRRSDLTRADDLKDAR